MMRVRSADGTEIAFERQGAGPAVILVDGAMCYRAAGPMRPVAAVLAQDFTTYVYDRRGRGQSTDTVPYAVEREVDDLRALIEAAGGSAALYGMSSGAALALITAATTPGVSALALYEPPYVASVGVPVDGSYRRALDDALAAGRRGDAVALFMAQVGMPPAAIDGMRRSPAWPAFEAIAPTLAYDDSVMGDSRVPHDVAARVRVPALVLDGGESPVMLREAAKAVASALPDATYETLAGQTHDVAPDVLAARLGDFFARA